MSAKVRSVIIAFCSCASKFSMRQLIRTFLWLGGLALGLQSAWGFALIGPLAGASGGLSWQVTTIGYGLVGDLGGPHYIGEEYRRTTPVMYYACDASFLDYFGSGGANAIDQTFDILNGVMTNGVDSYDYTGLPAPTCSHLIP